MLHTAGEVWISISAAERAEGRTLARNRISLPGCQLALMLAAWVCLVTLGWAILVQYGARPGEFGLSPTVWPTDTTAQHSPKRDNLLVFVHPHCPCTRATVRQLARALSQSRSALTIQALVFLPADKPEDWAESSLVRELRAIPGTRVSLDPGGAQTRLFGVRTSGHVLMYAGDGRLIFSGGITPARGHEGSSAGMEGLITRLRGQEAGVDRSVVYGCPIIGPERCEFGDVPCPCSR